MREIAFDTETTGLNPNDGHRLVEIGCVELVNKVETGREFHRYLNPDRHIPSEAEAVHGLSIHFLSDKPRFPEIVADLLEFIGDSPLIAHNAHFDFGFLNWELAACGYDPICLSRMIDTLALARTRHPGAKHSLDALCTRYGIDRSQRIKHGALLDAQLLSQVYVELSGGRQIGFSLAADPGIGAAIQATAPAVDRPIRAPRPHAASDEELARHAAFIATLVAPLWTELSAAA
ncbi:DNA polymerase-3 subunit epsilon [Sphingomonas vulcanisoli]|uniref:DNA polymerase III subunit epsilon n=1 Tax=Sphingomonas vulcanisoli TaxID=1658060 RepID=A0ABX0TQP8_9SPHN|nr:DNA polymerase III subunit epsilon [Sphingomonas vulcanisoli]NIJ07413.1 DNA polymerase-3 subunit epsilon [Sphingomonas vulcanisoli]